MGCWLCQLIFSRRTGTERWRELDPWAWLGTFHVPQMTEELVFSLGNEVNCVGEKLDPRCCCLSCLSVLGHGVVSEQAHSPGSLRGPAGICSAPSHGMARGDTGEQGGCRSRKGTCQRHHKGSEATGRGTALQPALGVLTHGSGTWSSLSCCPTESLPHSKAWEGKSTWEEQTGAGPGPGACD